MSKYVWAWSSDGTVMYIYEIYQARFSNRHKLKQIKMWYTSDFDNVQLVAEQFIERLSK